MKAKKNEVIMHNLKTNMRFKSFTKRDAIKYAKQLDTTLDDGATDTGSVRVVNGLGATAPHVRGAAALAVAAVVDSNTYTVCMGL